MTAPEIMSQLEALGEEKLKKLLVKHGIKEPFFGVKVEHLKTIQKKVKKDYQLAKDLFATGNADAQYLAGLIADDAKMTRAELQNWAEQALSSNICGHTVPWVAAEGNYGFELGLQWIDSAQENIAIAGWATLGGVASLKPDDELDIAAYKALIERVAQTIHAAPNDVRSAMNVFVITVGTYIAALTEEAIAAAKKMGPVTVIKEGTACKVPDAVVYIDKSIAKGGIGKKKKTVKC